MNDLLGPAYIEKEMTPRQKLAFAAVVVTLSVFGIALGSWFVRNVGRLF